MENQQVKDQSIKLSSHCWFALVSFRKSKVRKETRASKKCPKDHIWDNRLL